jgi:pimeloyl-ACP methyl ester carboxylesterase
MGGYIALELANLFPQKIKKVVMLNSTAFPDSLEKKGNRDKTVEFLKNIGVDKFIPAFVPNLFSTEFAKSHQDLIKKLGERYQNLTVEGLVAASLAMKNRKDGRILLESTKIPFLFIQGKYDSLISTDDIQECVGMNNALHEMVLFDHSGHQATYEEPLKCFETIAHFLNLKNA